jgi:hypothetical protein
VRRAERAAWGVILVVGALVAYVGGRLLRMWLIGG